MKRIIFTYLFVASSVVIVLANGVANARYRYHHRQHHHRDIIYTPDRSTATVRNEWPYVQEEIIYPLASGTTVLDTYSGREPVISPFDCGYRGVDWYRVRHDWAYMANNLR